MAASLIVASLSPTQPLALAKSRVCKPSHRNTEYIVQFKNWRDNVHSTSTGLPLLQTFDGRLSKVPREMSRWNDEIEQKQRLTVLCFAKRKILQRQQLLLLWHFHQTKFRQFLWSKTTFRVSLQLSICKSVMQISITESESGGNPRIPRLIVFNHITSTGSIFFAGEYINVAQHVFLTSSSLQWKLRATKKTVAPHSWLPRAT